MANLDLVSVNVRGLNSSEKRDKKFSWLEDNKTNITLLQETHFIEKREELYDRKWNGKAIHAFSDSPFSRGVSVLFNKECIIDILNVHKSNDGRKLLVNAKIDETLLTIVNLYAPNKESDRIAFFNSLNTFISSHTPQDSKLIIGGDFNCNLNKENDKSCKKLSKLTNKLDLVDVWLKKIQRKMVIHGVMQKIPRRVE